MGFTEKYRPILLDQVIGQDEIKIRVRNCIDQGVEDFPTHLLFLGAPGTGKTTIAQIVGRELWGSEWRQYFHELNASDDRGIKIVREEIKKMAKILNKKIIFLTEFDQMTKDAQHALRRIMETHKKNTIFILDGNNASNIIGAIKSRCAVFYFQPLDDRTILKFLIRVIKREKVKVNPKDPAFRRAMTKLAVMSRGDVRSALNNLQTLISKNKEITYKNIVSLQPTEEAGTILNKALAGDVEGSIDLLEDYITQKNYRWEELFKSWRRILRDMPRREEDEQLKADKKALAYNILYKMGDFEARCRRGNEPLVQLTSFLAYVWHVPTLLVKQSATS